MVDVGQITKKSCQVGKVSRNYSGGALINAFGGARRRQGWP